MGWRMDVAQQDNISDMGIVTPGHTFQDVHGCSSLGRIVRWRRKDIEALNISEVCITVMVTSFISSSYRTRLSYLITVLVLSMAVA